jgi:hypothetical protein
MIIMLNPSKQLVFRPRQLLINDKNDLIISFARKMQTVLKRKSMESSSLNETLGRTCLKKKRFN